MLKLLSGTLRMASIAGAAMLVAGCGGDGDEAANQAAANAPDATMMLDSPANDASAMELVGNASEPVLPADNGMQGTDGGNVLGNSSGGDTGGNAAEGNVSGM